MGRHSIAVVTLGAFIVAAGFCLLGVLVALVFLPSRAHRSKDEGAEAMALSSARCPGAPNGGHLTRIAFMRRKPMSERAQLRANVDKT